MKIAIISMIREAWGGSEELWADMASEALNENDSVIHSSFDFEKPAIKEKTLIEKGLIHLPRRGFIKAGTPVPIRIIRKAINRVTNFFSNPFTAVFRLRPDHVLYNGTCYSIVNEKYLLLSLKKTGTSYSILGHYNQEDGRDIKDEQVAELRKIYAGATHVFFVSIRSLENARIRTGSDISNARVIRNPVNMFPLKALAYPDNKETQLAMLGNLRITHKGQDIVLRILAKEEWKKRSWHLNIYGTGEDEAFLRNLVKESGIENRVSFHGRVNVIPAVWENNHILLMPSLMEGMPLAVVEAMICARAAVVTNVGGHAEWIEEDKEGWIADKPQLFEQALEKAWSHRDSWEKLGLNAHQKAMRLYDPAPGKTLLTILKTTTKNGSI